MPNNGLSVVLNATTDELMADMPTRECLYQQLKFLDMRNRS
nr:hypothetical protein [Anabaena sp. UHCC 0253]